jgi:hypothetical protein
MQHKSVQAILAGVNILVAVFLFDIPAAVEFGRSAARPLRGRTGGGATP